MTLPLFGELPAARLAARKTSGPWCSAQCPELRVEQGATCQLYQSPLKASVEPWSVGQFVRAKCCVEEKP